MTLPQVRKKFGQKLSLNLSENMLQAGFCERLEEILLPYRSRFSKENSFKQDSDKHKDDESNLLEDSCQVVINYHRSDSRGCIFLGKDWSVSPEDELLRNLRFEYGDDHVELDYKRTTSLT